MNLNVCSIEKIYGALLFPQCLSLFLDAKLAEVLFRLQPTDQLFAKQ